MQMNQGRILLILAAFSALSVVSQAQVWKQIGPDPFKDNGAFARDTPNATLSGLVSDIAIDPSGSTDSTIYIATAAGGVWKTTDGGSNWSPLTDSVPAAQTMGVVALDPTNPLIVYAGVGGWYCCAGGGGIYRSADGGQTWSVLNPNGIFTGIGINRIVLPASGTLLVATNLGVFKSVTSGQQFGNNSPAFDNSQPIPITFPSSYAGASALPIGDLKLDTAAPNTVYAGMWGWGIFKSTDAGTSFPASGWMFTLDNLPDAIWGFDYITFAQSTLPDNKTFYVTIAVQDGQPLGPPFCTNVSQSYVPSLAMFKSTDGGATWARITLGADVLVSLQGGGYDQTIGVDPQDANRVYIGLRGLFASSDGGSSGFYDSGQAQRSGCHDPGNQNNNINAGKAHVDQHAIYFSPASHYTGPPTRVFTGNDGGFATTALQGSAPGSQWQLLNNGLATIMFYGMDMGCGGLANDAYTYGGSQDNGTIVRTPSQSGLSGWKLGYGGDDVAVAVDPQSPTHAISIADGCFISTDSALNWSEPPPQGTSLLDKLRNRCNNVFPLGTPALSQVYFDPGGGTAYASAGPKLFQSRTNGQKFLLMHTFPQNVTAMNQVKGDHGTIWVGLSDGTVQFTQDAQKGPAATWTARTVNVAPPGGTTPAVSGIAIDPVNTGTVIVVYPGFSGVTPSQHAFLTNTFGTTWSDISGTAQDNSLPDLPLHAVVIVPYTSPHTIVVGSEAGVMQSADLGQSWQVLGTGFPTVRVTALAFDPQVTPPVLRASTFGRSVFELPFDPAAPQCQATYTCDTMTITCNGPGVSIDFCGTPNKSGVSEPGCSVGVNTVSLTSLRTAPIEGNACTVNEGAKTCIKLGFQYGGEEPVGPPGEPCQPCEQGYVWCTKYGPPRCVPHNQCMLTPPVR
jgi:photosystem II stability/assembly factor-like uncharacterized protein